MARSTKDPQYTELVEILESMLKSDETITARAVTRKHSLINNASDLTRHEGRREILDKFQGKQSEIRSFVGYVKNIGTSAAANSLQLSDERIRAFEANEKARINSHLAMISAVAELGGTQKLLMFYEKYSAIRDSLARQGALPSEFGSNVTSLTRK